MLETAGVPESIVLYVRCLVILDVTLLTILIADVFSQTISKLSPV